MIKQRLARLREIIRQEGLDALLVTYPANRRYLSGFKPDDGQWGESSGALLISPHQALLLTDFRYQKSAQEQARYYTVRIYKKGLVPELAGLLAGSGIKRLGVEARGLLLSLHQALAAELKGIDLVPTQGLVSRLRQIKDQREVEAMSRSLALMESVLEQVLDGEIAGRSERELALAITRTVEDAGAEGVAFEPIVASGPQGAEPHAVPGRRIIQAGEPVIFDVGARLQGYCSDLSRTVVAGGKNAADQRFREIYQVVRRAQERAIQGIRPGMTGAQADALAREVIEEAGYGPNFGHALGHGVGLETHEAPGLGPHSQQVLEAGMVFTIEPGIYLSGWGGIRLEQMVELTGQGCRLLNRLGWFLDE